MPYGDGTGPAGGGRGRAGGGRSGGGRGGGGRGRMGGFSLGPGGDCVCPSCGTRVAHKMGTPCTKMKCPGCGAPMTRER